MPEPFLECANADAIFQRRGCKRVAKLVKKPFPAMRSFATLVTMFGHAVTAIQTGAPGNSFQPILKFLVGHASARREDQVVWVLPGLAGFVFFEHRQKGRRYGNLPLFLVLRFEPQLFLRRDSHAFAVEIDVWPSSVPDLLVARSPVKRKNKYGTFSSGVHALNRASRSSGWYISRTFATNLGLSRPFRRPAIPCNLSHCSTMPMRLKTVRASLPFE